MRESHRRFLAFASCACIAWAGASAQAAEQPDSVDAPTTLDNRVADLERIVSDHEDDLSGIEPPKPKTIPDPSMGSERTRYNPSRGWMANYGGFDVDVDLHGFVNVEYIDAEEDGKEDGDSTFDLHHANVFLDVFLRSNLRSHVEIEFEHAGDEVELDQAYVELNLKPWLSITAGRFYAPFGNERFVWYPMANPLVSRPIAAREIAPGSFYQTGLMFSGVFDCHPDALVTYELSVSNGLGEDAATDRRSSRQTRDNNSNKAVTGRIAGVAWSRVEIGTSGHLQDYESSGSGKDQRLYFLGVDLSARWAGFEMRGEYIHGNAQRPSASNLKQAGWYTQLAYTVSIHQWWMDSITPVFRVDGANLDHGVRGDNDRMRYSFGTVFRIYDQLQFKAEYQIATERGPNLDNDAFLAALVLDF